MLPCPAPRPLCAATRTTWLTSQRISFLFGLSVLAGIVAQAEAAAKDLEIAAQREQFLKLREGEIAQFDDIKQNLVEESRRVLGAAVGDAKQVSEAAVQSRWDRTTSFPWLPSVGTGGHKESSHSNRNSLREVTRLLYDRMTTPSSHFLSCGRSVPC